jgi:hypothetical protein
MGNFSSFADFLIKLLVFGLPFSLFYFLITNKKSRIRFFLLLMLFILSGIGATYFYISLRSRQNSASSQYLGFYHLKTLNKKSCNNCRIYLHANRKYDIIQNEQIIGKGKWEVRFDSESGSYYLHIDNGPNYMIWPGNRTIDYIDGIEK